MNLRTTLLSAAAAFALGVSALAAPVLAEETVMVGGAEMYPSKNIIENAVRARLPWLEIEAPDGLTLNLDGEPMQGTRFRVDVLPGRLHLRAPLHSQVIANDDKPAAA